MTPPSRHVPPRRLARLLPFALTGIGFVMLGMSFAAVPLYRAFCRATGYGGTPQIGGIATNLQNQGQVVVRFNA